MFVVHISMFAVHTSMFVEHISMLVVHVITFAVHTSMFVAHISMFVVHTNMFLVHTSMIVTHTMWVDPCWGCCWLPMLRLLFVANHLLTVCLPCATFAELIAKCEWSRVGVAGGFQWNRIKSIGGSDCRICYLYTVYKVLLNKILGPLNNRIFLITTPFFCCSGLVLVVIVVHINVFAIQQS